MKEIIACKTSEITLRQMAQLERDGFDGIVKGGVFIAQRENAEN